MQAVYYSPSTGAVSRATSEGAIAVPAAVIAQLMEDQRNGKEITRQPDGTPNDVAALLTLNGMRAAVLREVRAQRALILNALTGIGYDAMRAGNTALMAEVDAARLFLRNITADPDVLAVTPEGGGWQAMGDLILTKWRNYAAGSSATIRGAFAEIA